MRENERNDIQSKVFSKYCLYLIVVNYTKLCYQNGAERLLSQNIYENNYQQISLMLLLDVSQSTQINKASLIMYD